MHFINLRNHDTIRFNVLVFDTHSPAILIWFKCNMDRPNTFIIYTIQIIDVQRYVSVDYIIVIVEYNTIYFLH